MLSPIRLTTASTPPNAASGERSWTGFQACHATVGLVLRARAGSRLQTAISSPRASSASQTADPISPLAPVARHAWGLALLPSLPRPTR